MNEHSGSSPSLSGAENLGYKFTNLDQNKVSCACHPAMGSNPAVNKRIGFTDLDFALLKDIGYQVSDAHQLG